MEEIRIPRDKNKELKLCMVQIIKQASEIIRLEEENCLDLQDNCIEKCNFLLEKLREVEEENLMALPF